MFLGCFFGGLQGGVPLLQAGELVYAGSSVSCRWEGVREVERAELWWTNGRSGLTAGWRMEPAEVSREERRASVELPSEAAACFLNLIDDQGCVVTSVGASIYSPLTSRPRS
ncbi:hypothetical protein O9H85_06295 [Paenibacillus filicis]|uniref:Ig-like domain-containing protein n=1 Tax=Paenibacillus gyeongsangnamensis TaxID=3388067 RepID=A0ABT4Q596_9BACL|nr:hypothetical protein [Paenibacillus filicis]MCZ8512042.1 hypothetical protein [Paenibacillus filicis]